MSCLTRPDDSGTPRERASSSRSRHQELTLRTLNAVCLRARRGLANTAYSFEKFPRSQIWLLRKEHGLEKYRSDNSQNVEQARYLESLIAAQPELQLLAPSRSTSSASAMLTTPGRSATQRIERTIARRPTKRRRRAVKYNARRQICAEGGDYESSQPPRRLSYPDRQNTGIGPAANQQTVGEHAELNAE